MKRLTFIFFFIAWICITGFCQEQSAGSTREGIDQKVFLFSGTQNVEPTVSREEADVIQETVTLTEENLDRAIEFLKTKITSVSTPAFDFSLGNLYFQADKLQEAECAYKEAIRKQPNFMRARANLVHVLVSKDKIDEAIEQFKMVLLWGRPRPSTFTLMGYVFLLRNEPVPAEGAYRQAILLEPDDINAYLGLTKSLLMQERYRESIPLLQQLLEKYPRRKELWFLLANAHLSLEKPDRAITALECAKRLNVATPEALATLGDLYLNRNQPEQALCAYEVVFSQEDFLPERMLRAVEGFLMLRDTARSAVLIKKVLQGEDQGMISLTPQQIKKIRFLEAWMASIKGDFDSARKAYKKLLESDPLNGKALLSLGDLYRQEKKQEEALICYERAERVSDTAVEALLRQAQIEVDRGGYARAVELLEAAQKLKPQQSVARYLEQVRRFVQ